MQKFYDVPISISDSGSPTMTGISNLTVIIGDDNDNPMKDGSSSIFVYHLQVRSFIQIRLCTFEVYRV